MDVVAGQRPTPSGWRYIFRGVTYAIGMPMMSESAFCAAACDDYEASATGD